MGKFLELQTQVPDMSALDISDIYLGGLDPVVRVHLLGSPHVTTLERALEESRILLMLIAAMVFGSSDESTLTTNPCT